MKEIWKDIEDYEGLYQVSNIGRVKSVSKLVKTRWNNFRKTKDLILETTKNHKGYKLVMLSKNNKIKSKQVHRLVAIAFISNPNNLPQVNHKDGNKQNNCVSNLEWCSAKENMKHAYKIGLISKQAIKKCVIKAAEKRKKPILQIKDDIVVNEFDSIESAKKMLKVKSSGCLVNALKGRIRTYKGFVWTYKEKGN